MVVCGLIWPLGWLHWRPGKGDKPVILLHGQWHNRSGWLLLLWRLRRAGFGPIYGLNFIRLSDGRVRLCRLLRRLRGQGMRQVDIVGHSLGAILAADYLQKRQLQGIEVGRLISVAGRLGPQRAAPQLHTIAASRDWLVPKRSVLVAPRSRQAVIPRRSHLSILFSRRTHRQILTWLG